MCRSGWHSVALGRSQAPASPSSLSAHTSPWGDSLEQMVFWGTLPTNPRESPRAPRGTGKLALRFPAADQDSWRLFYSFFKSLVGKDVVVELKNDLSICGTLHSVDQYLNIKLTDISVTDPEKYPHMLSVKNCFIRGSVVRYVQLPADEVDTQLLQDAARKEALQQKQ
ncbi:U6 snRNA-associated Sm-like protein LSm2 isoform X2 [Peromyscus eremicus]|uniref:U6 snRNA-associated Sm-like protein LSm2 isoform X2 n=1 Tax=Peromyscus eremicus TaxID=42410 RepID=UPI0027DAE986|nr:U6 snRNA-associated Sm-like protein LSm2 isoform X2 [Peromyscus eremicus]